MDKKILTYFGIFVLIAVIIGGWFWFGGREGKNGINLDANSRETNEVEYNFTDEDIDPSLGIPDGRLYKNEEYISRDFGFKVNAIEGVIIEEKEPSRPYGDAGIVWVSNDALNQKNDVIVIVIRKNFEKRKQSDSLENILHVGGIRYEYNIDQNEFAGSYQMTATTVSPDEMYVIEIKLWSEEGDVYSFPVFQNEELFQKVVKNFSFI